MLDSSLHQLLNGELKSLKSTDDCESKSNHNLTNVHDVLFVILHNVLFTDRHIPLLQIKLYNWKSKHSRGLHYTQLEIIFPCSL